MSIGTFWLLPYYSHTERLFYLAQVKKDPCQHYLEIQSDKKVKFPLLFFSFNTGSYYSSLVSGLCWQRDEDDEGERQQSQQYPADCNTAD